jgi:hypothetical protein
LSSPTTPASPSATPSAPSALATISPSTSSVDAATDVGTDLCIQAASQDDFGFPITEIPVSAANVGHAIRAGFIPGLTSLPAADGQKYLYCYIASNITMGTGAARPATGATSATYLVYGRSTNVVVHRTTLNPPS